MSRMENPLKNPKLSLHQPRPSVAVGTNTHVNPLEYFNLQITTRKGPINKRAKSTEKFRLKREYFRKQSRRLEIVKKGKVKMKFRQLSHEGRESIDDIGEIKIKKYRDTKKLVFEDM